MAKKLPWFPWHADDWLSDEKLRSCSVAARGLWADVLSLMHKNDRRGYLQIGDSPVSAQQLARMTGCSTDEVTRLLAELFNAGVPSASDTGVLYSRRMVRDERKRLACSLAGKKGGRPDGEKAFRLKAKYKGEVGSPLPSDSPSSKRKKGGGGGKEGEALFPLRAWAKKYAARLGWTGPYAEAVAIWADDFAAAGVSLAELEAATKTVRRNPPRPFPPEHFAALQQALRAAKAKAPPPPAEEVAPAERWQGGSVLEAFKRSPPNGEAH